jgi:hypothetical protein
MALRPSGRLPTINTEPGQRHTSPPPRDVGWPQSLGVQAPAHWRGGQHRSTDHPTYSALSSARARHAKGQKQDPGLRTRPACGPSVRPERNPLNRLNCQVLQSAPKDLELSPSAKGGSRVINVKKALAAAVAGLTLGIAGVAFGVGGTNESGQSGHFNPQTRLARGQTISRTARAHTRGRGVSIQIHARARNGLERGSCCKACLPFRGKYCRNGAWARPS